MEFVSSVKNILILDSKGGRVAVKYYTDEWPTVSKQKQFEKAVFKKARKEKSILIEGEDNTIALGDNISVYTFSNDLHFFVTGSEDENDLILSEVLNGFFDAIDELSGQYVYMHFVDKKFILQHLQTVLLILDGLVDRGIILETDGEVILNG
ncbi:hypothetical protein QQ045_026349 [Rhodiola kirilowii]